MSSYKMKKPLRFPRCLNCSNMLWLRDSILRKKKYIQCTHCKLMYSRASIIDADPDRWNTVRKERLFTLKEDQRGRLFLTLKDGLGSRRQAC